MRERYLNGIEVCEGTAGDVDVVPVALLLLGLLIVVLEVVQRPGQAYESDAVGLQEVFQLEVRRHAPLGIRLDKDRLEVRDIRVVLTCSAVLDVAPLEVCLGEV